MTRRAGGATSGASLPSFEEYAGVAWPALYRYAYLLTGHHADAEDIAQQTLLKAYRSWSRVQASDSPPAYLRTMLVNTFLSYRRPKKHRLEVLTAAPPDSASSAPPGAASGLGERGPEERWALWPHVKLLPPQQRAVIVLRYYEDLTEQEIATTLGCSTGNVKSTAHRALKSLRAALDADADGTGTGTGTDGKES